MANRIYLGDSITSKYAKLIGAPLLTLTALFLVLLAVGFNISGTDDYCLGTPDDPCVSYGKICNPTPTTYDIYNSESVKLDFSPTIQEHYIFFKDGRYKKEFLLPKGINHSTVGWRYENFTNATKPRSDRIYVHRFAAYSCQEYMLVGLKNNPEDNIKWGMGISNEYLDPFWYGVNVTPATSAGDNITMELGSQVNITTNMSGISKVCVDIDHPEYGDNYTCGSPSATFVFNITYFRKTTLNDSSTSKNLTYAAAGNQTIYVRGHQYDELVNFKMKLKGYINDGDYPQEVKVYINNTLSNEVGVVYAGDLSHTEFSTGNYSNLTFDSGGTQTVYITLSNNSIINSAIMNVTGYENTINTTKIINDDFEDATLNKTIWEDHSFYGNCGGQGSGTISWGEYLADDGYWATSFDYYMSSYDHIFGRYLYTQDDFNNEQNHTLNFTIESSYTDVPFRMAIFDGVFVDTVSCDSGWTTGSHSPNGSTLLTSTSSISKGNWSITIRDGANVSLFDGAGALSNTINVSNLTEWHVVFYLYQKMIAEDTYIGSYKLYDYTSTSPLTENTDYSNNVSIDIGTLGGDSEWNHTGEFNSTHNEQISFVSPLQFYIGSYCEDDEQCAVPVYVTTTSHGGVNLTDLIINYSVISNLSLDTNLAEEYLGNETGFSNISIMIGSNTTGIIQISNIEYDYAGGNDTIEVLTYEMEPILKNYYDFENTTTPQTVLVDVMQDNNGTLVNMDGTDWTTGKSGFGLHFNGTDQKVTIDPIIPLGEWSISFWATREAAVDENAYIAQRTGDLTTGRMQIYSQSADKIVLSLVGGGNGSITSNEVIGDSDWHHYVFTRSEDNGGTIKLYQDGVLRNEKQEMANVTQEKNTSMGWQPGNNDYHNGTIDEVKIYDYVLTDGSCTNQSTCGGHIEILYGEGVINTIANKENNETLELMNYYSDWDYSFPNYVDYLEFIPSSPTSKNVTPYGQTSSTSIFNITTHNYGGIDSNFSMQVNETNSCVNLTVSTNSTESAGYTLNTTWQELFNSAPYLNVTRLWMWADYNCTGQLNWSWWFPEIYFRSCCDECDVCVEDLS